MGWVDPLRGGIVGLDTTPLIYFTEANPTYVEIVRPFFEAIQREEFTVVTSIVTLLEALVRPIKDGDAKLAQEYRDFLLETNNVTTYFLSQKIAEEAARLRAFYKLRTPDSIQMATAIYAEASFFFTNDARLPSLPNLKVLTLGTIKEDSQEKDTQKSNLENGFSQEG